MRECALNKTLWDLIFPVRRKPKPLRVEQKLPEKKKSQPGSMQERYEQMTRQMLKRYGVRVRKWRSSSSGLAWEVRYKDGSITRLIESPRPCGPMSAAIFLHEIGHHSIGFKRYRPRCLEEYHAWVFAMEQMAAWDLNITDRVHKRMHDSLQYAVDKAQRRGLKQVPGELEIYLRTNQSIS